MKMLITSFVAASLMTSIPFVAAAQQITKSTPSFNCARAKTETERTICSYPELGAKDRAIASLYRQIRTKTPQIRRRALAANQAEFNSYRANCFVPGEADEICLGQFMDQRIVEMNGWLSFGFRQD